MSQKFALPGSAPIAPGVNEGAQPDAAPPGSVNGDDVQAAAPEAAAPAPASGIPNWAKSGQAAREQMAKQRVRDEQRAKERGNLWDFYMKAGEPNVRITFLDGVMEKMGTESVLSPPIAYRQHELKIGGKYPKYVCLEDEEGSCPICDQGDEPVSVWAFTVIDHRVWPKQGGGTRTNQKKLFVCKSRTAETLVKHAAKCDGLQGVTFDVSRSDSKVARVGDLFMPDEKLTGKEIMERYGDADNKLHEPTNYAEELPFYTSKQLVEMNVVQAQQSVGGHGSSNPNDGEVPF